MGEPGEGHASSSPAECIGGWKPTEGSETSQYLQEEVIPGSGERKGNGKPDLRAEVLRDSDGRKAGVKNQHASRTVWEDGPQKVIVL